MKTDLRISDTEWEIKRVAWARHPVTAAEIIASLAERDPTWHPKTVRTLLARLVGKKALGYQSEGRAYVYTPLVKESECVAAASETFVERVFGGSLRPMLAHLVETKKLTRADINELRALLDAKAPASRKPSRK
ncbi:MAG: BlaI/MecI/CopY family transcriptional regulator [Opitutaceae bacterium]|jgi:BlaI family penicillinase repressor|nr:BlaI/MecI/CopY family transcriptional regulator [Opitutaceae bacterium]